MAINLTRTYPTSGWTAGSIAPRQLSPAITGPGMNIPMSGNIPANIMQAIGNLSADQAFRQFLGQQVMGQQQQQPQFMFPPPNPADEIRAKTEQARQQAAQVAASNAMRQLGFNQQQISNFPALAGGIAPMGMGAQRAALQQNQFSLENQLAAANAAAWGTPQPQANRFSGWVPQFGFGF